MKPGGFDQTDGDFSTIVHQLNTQCPGAYVMKMHDIIAMRPYHYWLASYFCPMMQYSHNMTTWYEHILSNHYIQLRTLIYCYAKWYVFIHFRHCHTKCGSEVPSISIDIYALDLSQVNIKYNSLFGGRHTYTIAACSSLSFVCWQMGSQLWRPSYIF